MTRRGEYRNQLAALVAVAKVDNLNFMDIVPDDMQDQLSHGAGIKEAQDLIKDLKKREEELRTRIETLSKDLDDKQLQIDNFSPIQIDLQQAQRRIVDQKNTIDDLTQRVERYRVQAKEIVDVKRADAAVTEKNENLQMQMRDQQTIIDKLMEDNRKSKAIFEQLREADAKAVERKDTLLAKKEEELAKQAEKLGQQAQEMVNLTIAREDPYYVSSDDNDTNMSVNLSRDSLLTLQAENIGLLEENLRLLETNEALEEQLIKMQTQLFQASASKQASDRVFAGIVSETKTLRHFYKESSETVGSVAKFFSSPKTDIPSLDDICTQLNATQNALMGYHEVKVLVRAMNTLPEGDTEQAALYVELDSLAAVAFNSAIRLESLHSGLWSFLDSLAYEPTMLSDMNVALCDIDRVPCVELMRRDSVDSEPD